MIGLLAIICSLVWMASIKAKDDFGKLSIFFYGLYLATMIVELI
jgi:hypothetical protein